MNQNQVYHSKIAQQILKNQVKALEQIKHPDMFNNELQSLSQLHDNIIYGGARPSPYVMTGNNVASSEPSTLAVRSSLTNEEPNEMMNAGSIRKRKGRPRKIEGGNVYDTMGEVAKTVAPMALRYGLPLLMGLGEENKKRGRPKKGGMLNTEPVVTAKEIVVAKR
jgi:hypothetical protein